MRLWIAEPVLDEITRLADAFAPLETGGVLVGWRSGGDRVVAAALGPGPRALHGRHMFIPHDAWQIAAIDRLFALSGGDLDYLGDWHTHPDGIAAMSALDRKTLRKLGRKTGDAVMAIAAPEEGRWRLAAWRQPRGGWLDRPEAEDCEMVPFAPDAQAADWARLAHGLE